MDHRTCSYCKESKTHENFRTDKLNKSGFVNIKVFNILGKEIEVLINARQSAGEYGVSFDASNYPGGVYFYSLYVDNKIIDTKKMILIR